VSGLDLANSRILSRIVCLGLGKMELIIKGPNVFDTDAQVLTQNVRATNWRKEGRKRKDQLSFEQGSFPSRKHSQPKSLGTKAPPELDSS